LEVSPLDRGHCFLELAPPAEAQLKGKPRIGVITPAERQWEGAAFRAALRSLGYIEGTNILIDVRSGEGKLDRMPELAAALINSGVDVILAVNTPGARAAIEATKTVPIIMAAIGDPVGLGLVPSLARPGGNVTGLSNMSGDLAGKRLELLKEAVPAAKRIAVMMHPEDPIVPMQVKDVNARPLVSEWRWKLFQCVRPTSLKVLFKELFTGRARIIAVGRPSDGDRPTDGRASSETQDARYAARQTGCRSRCAHVIFYRSSCAVSARCHVRR